MQIKTNLRSWNIKVCCHPLCIRGQFQLQIKAITINCLPFQTRSSLAMFVMTPENAESSHNPEWWWGEKWCCLLSSCGCITGIMFHDGGSGVEGWKNGWKANVTNGGGGCGAAAGVSGPGRNWGKMPGAETLFLPSVRYCAALLLKLLPLHRVTKQRGRIYITSDICFALNWAV